MWLQVLLSLSAGDTPRHHSASVCLSVCHSWYVCLSQSVCLCVIVCHCLYMWLQVLLSLSAGDTPRHHCASVCLFVCLSVTVCISVCVSLSVCLFVCLSVTVCMSLCVSLSVCLCVIVCRCLYVWLQVLLSLSAGDTPRHHRASLDSRDNGSVIPDSPVYGGPVSPGRVSRATPSLPPRERTWMHSVTAYLMKQTYIAMLIVMMVIVLVIAIVTTVFIVLSLWRSSAGSYDKCSMSVGRPPTFGPSQKAIFAKNAISLEL